MNLSIIQKTKLKMSISIIAKQNNNNRITGWSLGNDLYHLKELSEKRTKLSQKVHDMITPTYKIDAKLERIRKALSADTLTVDEIKNIKTYAYQVKMQKLDFEMLKDEVKLLKEQEKNNKTAYNQAKTNQAQQQTKTTQAQQQTKTTQAQQQAKQTSSQQQTKATQSQQQTKQTPSQQSEIIESDKGTLTQEQKEVEREVIRINKTFIKDAETFLRDVSINDLDYKTKLCDLLYSRYGDSESFDINADVDDLLKTLKEEISNAHQNARHSQMALGEAYIHNNGKDEIMDAWHEMDSSSQVNPPKTFKNTKNQETTYANFNESNSTAIINFEPPIKEIDIENSNCGVAYNQQTGAKYYIGEIKKSNVNGVCVKISNNGLINFNLPENKSLLSHPEVLSKLIETYPESFKTLPAVVYAADPKLFAESFKKGIIQKAQSSEIGKQSKEDYYFNADYELSQMNDRAMSSIIKTSQVQKKAIEAVNKQVQIEQEMGN